jgi:hypothetical protein
MHDAEPGTRLRPGSLEAVAALRFPLVPRSRPVCRPLGARVTRVCDLARAAAAGGRDALERAAEALNLAALILSDCALPDLAVQLCQRQATCLAGSGPHDLKTARLALQPVINIGRLMSLAGSPAAHQHFTVLLDAVAGRADMVIGGVPVSFATLTCDDDHRELVGWLWRAVLADGTRALARAGRWAEALEYSTEHNGVGDRLLDGRQVLILARSAERDHEAALAVLAATSTPSAWEQALAACLEALVLALAGRLTSAAVTAMADACGHPDIASEHAVFRARLGLCALDLATGTRHEPVIASRVIRTALDAADAYAAREVTSHHQCLHHATAHQHGILARTVSEARLGHGMPPGELDRLMNAASASEATMTAMLTARA